MKGSMTPLQKDGKPVSLYLSQPQDGSPPPTLYMLAGPDPSLELTGALEKAEKSGGRPFNAVAVGTNSWNSDYSPWPAAPVIKGEPEFTGGAAEMLAWLTGDLISYMEKTYPQLISPKGRIILGYSLAGLTALYAMYVTDSFAACGSCSGSLWYDGWTDYMAAHTVRSHSRIYLSLGKNEEKAKNPRMAAVGEATRAAHALLSREAGVIETVLEQSDGGHFSNIPERMGKAVSWLVR